MDFKIDLIYVVFKSKSNWIYSNSRYPCNFFSNYRLLIPSRFSLLVVVNLLSSALQEDLSTERPHSLQRQRELSTWPNSRMKGTSMLFINQPFIFVRLHLILSALSLTAALASAKIHVYILPNFVIYAVQRFNTQFYCVSIRLPETLVCSI